MLIFWGATIFGSVLFLLRVILFIAGGLGAEMDDGDVADSGDAEVAAHHSHMAEAGNGAFRLLSLNSMTGFVAMFGWAVLPRTLNTAWGCLPRFAREQRIQTAEFNARAVEGENTAKAEIAVSTATLAEREAEAKKRGEVAQQSAFAEIQQAKALAEQRRLEAEEVVPREIERRKLEIDATAHAEQQRLLAQGEADAIQLLKAAEADGIKKVLDAKAAGYETLIKAANEDANSAATLLLVEKLEEIVKLQTEAVKNIKFDKITVWDNANGDTSSTANFMRNLVKTLPPLHDIAEQAGLDLPGFLGTMDSAKKTAPS